MLNKMGNIYYYIGQISRWLGYSVLSSWKIPECNINLVEICFSLLEQDSILPIIVQVGAFDGVSNDYLTDILTKKNYQAAYLVEPQPRAVGKLYEKYSNQNNIYIIEAAISHVDETIMMYFSDSFDQKASLNIDHFSKFGLPKRSIHSFLVEGMTVKTFCSKYHLNRIDLLQIDTEGLDLLVLKMFLAVVNLPLTTGIVF